MLSLKSKEIASLLKAGDAFEADESNGAYTVAFDPQFPYICVAIHNGNRCADALAPYMALSEEMRIFEESPHTGDLISGYPNRIVCHDSLYEYDLNRPEKESISFAEGLWAKKPPKALTDKSQAKHRSFYAMYDAFISALIERHGFCVIYDLHAYNGQQHGGSKAPAFNIGTAQIDMQKYRRHIDYLHKNLEKIFVSGELIWAIKDDIYYGKGYLATRTKDVSAEALCVPLEIRKLYCDEKTGTLYPQTFSELKDGLMRVIPDHAAFCLSKQVKERKVKRHEMLGSDIEPVVKKLDNELFKLAHSFETLLYVNPVNIAQEERKFFAHKERYEPALKYRKLDIDPFLFKEKLFRLPIEEISDITLQTLYKRAVEGLSTKVDLLAAIGSRSCLYNALRYYAEPGKTDIENARFLLHAPPIDEEETAEETLSDAEIAKLLQDYVAQYNLQAPVKISAHTIAGAMVDNANYRVLIKKGNVMPRTEVQALKHHEIGVHLLSAANARSQPLQLFRLGLPGSTETQEGMAVMAEYLSGNLSLGRLKILALRVMAVRYMLDGHSFSRTYDMLIENFGAIPERAFTTTLRVFRGGGFTKDYLYLRGLAKAYVHWKAGKSWEPLMLGKTAFADFDRVQELMKRGVLVKPPCMPEAFDMQVSQHPIYDYLLSSLKYEDDV